MALRPDITLSVSSRRRQYDYMKQKLIRLSRRYVAALRTHVQPGPRASLQPALELGRQAVALGVETLELARIHEHAIDTLELSTAKMGYQAGGEIFLRGNHADCGDASSRAAEQDRFEPAERRR